MVFWAELKQIDVVSGAPAAAVTCKTLFLSLSGDSFTQFRFSEEKDWEMDSFAASQVNLYPIQPASSSVVHGFNLRLSSTDPSSTCSASGLKTSAVEESRKSECYGGWDNSAHWSWRKHVEIDQEENSNLIITKGCRINFITVHMTWILILTIHSLQGALFIMLVRYTTELWRVFKH